MIVACAQYAVRELDPETNLQRSVRAIREAADSGADLVVLPELANSGCDFSSREQALELAEEVGETRGNPGGPMLRAWMEALEKSGVFVVGGFLEREGSSLYNSAA